MNNNEIDELPQAEDMEFDTDFFPNDTDLDTFEEEVFNSQSDKIASYKDLNKEIFQGLDIEKKQDIENKFVSKTFLQADKERILNTFLKTYFVQSPNQSDYTEKWNIVKYYNAFSRKQKNCRLSAGAAARIVKKFFKNEINNADNRYETTISLTGSGQKYYPWVFKGEQHIEEIPNGEEDTDLEDLVLVRKWHLSITAVRQEDVDDLQRMDNRYLDFALKQVTEARNAAGQTWDTNFGNPLARNVEQFCLETAIKGNAQVCVDTQTILKLLVKHLVPNDENEDIPEPQRVINAAFMETVDGLHEVCNTNNQALRDALQRAENEKVGLQAVNAKKDTTIAKLKAKNTTLKNQVNVLRNSNR